MWVGLEASEMGVGSEYWEGMIHGQKKNDGNGLSGSLQDDVFDMLSRNKNNAAICCPEK